MAAATRLDGRVALVTGASRGVGEATARALAEAGASLGLVSTSLEGTRALAAELVSAGHRACAVAADVADAEQGARAIVEVERALGPVDLLINNAGVVVRKLAAEMEDADFDRVLAVNLQAPFYLSRRVLPGMVARGWGRVINISSISSRMGTPTLTAYCASKWGLNGLTQALSEEVKAHGVLVAAVLPGSVDTDMLKGSGFSPAMSPQDVARVVRFLCAEAPLAMSGSLVEVFG